MVIIKSKLDESTSKKEVEYTIISKGRKYFKGKDKKGYTHDIIINDISKDFEVGSKISFFAEVNFEYTEYGAKVIVTPLSMNIDSSMKDELERKRVEDYIGYIENAAYEKGYYYQKGIDFVKPLLSKYPEFKDRYNNAITHVKDIKRKETIIKYIDYVEDAAYKKGYIYTNGIKTLEDNGIEDFPKYYERMKAALEYVKELKKAKNLEKQKKISNRYPYTRYDAPELGTVVNIAPYSKEGKYVVFTNVGKEFYISEDFADIGYSNLMGHEGEKAAFYYYRDATEEEIIKYKDEEEKRERMKQSKIAKDKELEKIKNMIIDKGFYDAKKISFPNGVRYADSFNIYGGGECFVINDRQIWYIRNNGSDGDDWSKNNIKTGGAGAIGWFIRYDPKIASIIQENS